MGGQAILQVDARERGRELPQIGGGCGGEPGELAEDPMDCGESGCSVRVGRTA